MGMLASCMTPCFPKQPPKKTEQNFAIYNTTTKCHKSRPKKTKRVQKEFELEGSNEVGNAQTQLSGPHLSANLHITVLSGLHFPPFLTIVLYTRESQQTWQRGMQEPHSIIDQVNF